MTGRALALLALLSCARSAAGPTLLDGFDELGPWHAAASDGVRAAVKPAPGAKAMRLEVDFAGTAGYGFARRDLPLELPENFEISFDLRGDIPVNHLEFKLTDAANENVWWFRRPDFEFPTQWRHMTIKKRQIEFAWGPTQDKTLRRAAAVEIVVTSGRGGGKGWVEIENLAIRALPEESGPPPPPRASASSALPGAGAALALDGQPSTAWRSDPGHGAAQTFGVDLVRERDLAGVIVDWEARGHASDYTVETSLDGKSWQVVGRVSGGNGGRNPFVLAEASARYVRLRLQRGPASGYALAELAVVDVEKAGGANGFIAALAKRSTRGTYPRGFTGEQPYWTLVGVDGGHLTGLLSEDGAVEVRPGGASIEPFVQVGSQLWSWANAEISQSLVDGYLPLPNVTWRAPGWELTVSAMGVGEAGSAQIVVGYALRNLTDQPLDARLVLAIRPLQVNPPTQFLNIAGGVTPIREMSWDDTKLNINGPNGEQVELFPLPKPAQVSLSPFHAGAFPEVALATTPAAVSDPSGLASAALAYDLHIPPRDVATVAVAAPLDGPVALPPATAPLAAWLEEQLRANRSAWHEKLDRVAIRLPEAGRPFLQTLRSSLAYMLLSRDGPNLRPGTRSYGRSWIRDGAMIGEALLRLGHAPVAANYLRWYAPYQFKNGKVPCCVEANGAVPVPENDSHGELIYLAAEVYRYTRDRALLASLWPGVDSAARYLETLRQSERTAANQTAERRPMYGLLPPSISHEGYSAKPAYSYWDDFWGLRGYKDAAFIAGVLGEKGAEARLTAQGDEFRRELYASLAASAAAHDIAYIPGAADLGDFDATSTTIAVAPGGEQHALPAAMLLATFERYWRDFVARRDGQKPWSDYTPYELRVVGTFVRLGWRARAQQALAFFFEGRRPQAWNQWAEVVGNPMRQPRFIGDMPHAWVHSDFARSALDMFAYEREADRSLVVAAGIPSAWLAGPGIAIEGLRTPSGPLGYSLREAGGKLVLEIGAGQVPPGGIVFPWPHDLREAVPAATRINGRPSSWRGTPPELLITARPAKVVISRGHP